MQSSQELKAKLVKLAHDSGNRLVVAMGKVRKARKEFLNQNPKGTSVAIDELEQELATLAEIQRGLKQCILDMEDLGNDPETAQIHACAQQFSQLIETTNDGFVVHDPSGAIVRYNQAALDLLGLSEDQLLGRTPTDPNWETYREDGCLFPGDEHPAAIALRTGKKVKNALMGVRISVAEIRWIRINASPYIMHKSGQPAMVEGQAGGMHVMVTFTDVTDFVAARSQFDQLISALNKNAIIAFTDRRGIISDVNENFIRVSGFARQEVVGATHRIVSSQNHPMAFYDELWDSISSGNVWSGEVENRRKDKTSYWVRTVIAPITDSDRNIIKYVAISFEITHQKAAELDNDRLRFQLEAALKESRENERAFHAIFEYAPIGIVQLDQKFGFVAANSSFVNLLGYSLVELRCKTMLEVIHPDDRNHFLGIESSSKLIERLTRLNSEIRYIHSSGNTVWGRHSRRMIYDQDSGVVQYLCAIEDVTDFHAKSELLRESQLKLVESENNLRVVLRHVPSMIFVKDFRNDLRFSLLNRAGEELLGVKQSDLMGKSDFDLFPKDQAEFFRQNDLAVIAQGNVLKIDQEEINTPKGRRLLRTYKVPTFDEMGSPHLLIGISNDITDEIEAKQALDLERSKSIRNAKMASLGELAAGVAHEVNNPLTVIVGTVRTILSCGDDEKLLQQKVERIDRAAERIAKIVRGLRKFSRTSQNTAHLVRNLRDIAEESIILTASKAQYLSTPVTIESRGKVDISCDEIEIEQVLINLVNNAIDAVKELNPRWVKLEIFETECDVVVQVRDSGDGIKPEIQANLFQPFFTTKPVGEGTGLGLPIVKGILDEHKATITVLNSDPNTCFEIRFPKPENQKNAA